MPARDVHDRGHITRLTVIEVTAPRRTAVLAWAADRHDKKSYEPHSIARHLGDAAVGYIEPIDEPPLTCSVWAVTMRPSGPQRYATAPAMSSVEMGSRSI